MRQALLGTALLSVSALRSASPQAPQRLAIPLWWATASAGLGASDVTSNQVEPAYRGSLQSTFRAGAGARLECWLGVGVEMSRGIDFGTGDCVTIYPNPDCSPPLKHNAIAADLLVATGRHSPVVHTGIGRYRLTADIHGQTHSVAGLHVGGEALLLGGRNAAISIGGRWTVLPGAPEGRAMMLSFYLGISLLGTERQH